MKQETIFSQWKAHRRQVPVPDDFSARMMARIQGHAPMEEFELPAGLTGIRNRPAQWSVAAGLVLLGLFRVFYIAATLLRTHPLVPY